jgi:predicted enzyme related to lactoylglutathione lyase
MRQGDRSGVSLYVRVRDLRTSLDLAVELGGEVVLEPFDVPGGPTIAAVNDPEGIQLVLVQQ